MKLEDQVVSLELAKRLKELGVKQDSYFVWWYTEAMSTSKKYFPEEDWDAKEWSLRLRTSHMKDSGRDLAAFTVAELGEMLPATIDDEGMDARLALQKQNDGWWCLYGHYGMEVDVHKIHGDTEADARAKMLIYLLENELIDKPVEI